MEERRKTMSGNENEALFQGLVFSLAAGAMQQMGKTVNPMSGKVEKDLAHAQMTIDMLDMLEAKTQGNLTENESKLLKRIIGDLKLNYVEELKDEQAAAAKGEEAKGEGKPEGEKSAE